MKEASGELNMTLITIVAIVAIAALFTTWLLPRIQRSIDERWEKTDDIGCVKYDANGVCEQYK